MRIPTIKNRPLPSTIDFALAETSLPLRIINALEDIEVIMVKDLLKMSKSELLEIKNFGKTALRQVHASLRELDLKMEWR